MDSSPIATRTCRKLSFRSGLGAWLIDDRGVGNPVASSGISACGIGTDAFGDIITQQIAEPAS